MIAITTRSSISVKPRRCDLCHPPLSSVDVAPRSVGYEAAALLDRLMGGERPPARPILLPPRGVVGRRSTDVLATEDHELARAIHGLRAQACSGLRLKDYLKTMSLSHRALERGTRKLLGRSPKEEIIRVQLERARRLLTDSEFRVATVAQKCGFAQAKYFCQVFRERVGLTPRRLSEANQAATVRAGRGSLNRAATPSRTIAKSYGIRVICRVAPDLDSR